MSYLKPCRKCPKNNSCKKQDDFRAGSKGLGLLSATISCHEYKMLFPIGSRVSIYVNVLMGGRFWLNNLTTENHDTLFGTVVKNKGQKFYVVFDEVPMLSIYRLNADGADCKVMSQRLALYPSEIKLINNDRWKVCSSCCAPKKNNHKCMNVLITPATEGKPFDISCNAWDFS